jgi:hypothetical protein
MLTQLFAQRELRVALLLLGLAIVTASVLLISAASQTVAVEVNQNLGHYWRTTYDILVRPQGERTPIEEKYGLVQANHLSSIFGGITAEQYDAIKNIAGVEVAAPIAMLGMIIHNIPTDDLGQLSGPGIYLLQTTHHVDDGVRHHTWEQNNYYYYGQDIPIWQRDPDWQNYPVVNWEYDIWGWSFLWFMLAGIDPQQEAALVNIDQAIVDGQYLSPDDQIRGGRYTILPTLFNATPYISRTVQATLMTVETDVNPLELADIMERGGTEYLATLPAGDTLKKREMNTTEAYEKLLEAFRSGELGQGLTSTVYWPDRVQYREVTAPFISAGPVFQVIVPDNQGGLPAYRDFTGLPGNSQFGEARLRGRGIFDIENIPQPLDVNRVPLETYFPPLATLYYDEAGQPVEPQTWRPTGFVADYIQSPPLLLTTIDAALLACGNDCISAIRVRVGDIDELTPAAQRKIETIAGEIAHLTGLDVDIMVGSSPSRILVHVPGVGYVEEQWIQKNVTATYQERVQTGHLILLAVLLGIGGLFVLDLAWADVVARRRIIALQKALGWRSSTVFGLVLGRLLLVGLLATTLGALLAWSLTRLSGWEPLSLSLLAGVPLLVITISLLGGLYPAWLAARVPPIVGLQHGNIQPATGNRPGSSFFPLPSAFFLLAWRGLARRWSRSVLGGLTAALSAALLVLMLGVTVDRQGAMSGTLLGEFILVRIEGYHYAIAGIGFGLAALSLANSLLAGVLERRREIGVLKAVGWHTATVARLFLLEGGLLGLLGGLAGTILGLAIFAGLHETVPSSLGWIGLAGVLTPVVVGALAALYPARVAAHIPPAEAVRYE